jgi:hypothetical protein
VIAKALIDLRRSSPTLRQFRRRWTQLCASALIHLCLPPDAPSSASPSSTSSSSSSSSSAAVSQHSSGFQAAEEKLERTLELFVDPGELYCNAEDHVHDHRVFDCLGCAAAFTRQ